jgi:hypothetical protein
MTPRVILVALIAVVLAATHWKAYHLGLKTERLASFEERSRTEKEIQNANKHDRQRADKALESMAARLVQMDVEGRRVRRALASSTSGRDCLSADAVGVLNAAADRSAVSTDPGGASERPGPAATAATDTETAEYIQQLIQYGQRCRAQVLTIRAAAGVE